MSHCLPAPLSSLPANLSQIKSKKGALDHQSGFSRSDSENFPTYLAKERENRLFQHTTDGFQAGIQPNDVDIKERHE